MFETNVFGVIAMTQAVLPHMRQAGGGTIINVGSIVGRVAVPFQGVYSATKHAVEALTDAVHYESSRFGIRMRVVEPGRIPTAFPSNLVSRRAPDESPYRAINREWEAGWSTMPGREELASAADVATAIVAASSDDSPRHVPVGNDSALLIAARESMSPEALAPLAEIDGLRLHGPQLDRLGLVVAWHSLRSLRGWVPSTGTPSAPANPRDGMVPVVGLGIRTVRGLW